MDFSIDSDEFYSTPCLLIESSQAEDAPISRKMDADPLHLRFMNKKFTSDPIDRTTHELNGIKIINALSGNGASNNNQYSSGNNNTNNNNTQGHHGQDQTSSSRIGGGGGGEGGGDGNDRRQQEQTEPDVCNESTSHSEDSGSSSIPDLIQVTDKPHSTKSFGASDQGGSFSSSESTNPSIKLSMSSSSTASTEPVGHQETLSQASTALADDVYQSRLENSEEGMPQLRKKSSSSSSSSSMGKSKSDTSSSSIYPASNASSLNASSLSSDATPSPQHHVLDTVKEDNKEREDEVCSQDLFADKEDSNAAISSQEVSRISTPKDRSTPVESRQTSKAQGLYKQALKRTSTPLLGSQEPQATPPSYSGFNCLQLSGSSSGGECAKQDVSHDSYLETPLILPSTPTEDVVKYTTVTTTGSSSYSDNNVIAPSPNSFHTRTTALSSTPEESHNSNSEQQTTRSSSSGQSSEIINPSPDSFDCRPTTVPSTPEDQENPDEDEFAGLPQWQQDLLAQQKEPSLTSITSPEDHSYSAASCNDEVEDGVEAHPWQSVDSSKSESLTSREKPTTVKHVTFLLDKSQSPPVQSQERIGQIEGGEQSFSPSSLVVDEQHGMVKLVSPQKNKKNTGCSQPELSEDLFCVSSCITQEDSDDKGQDPSQVFSQAAHNEEQVEEDMFDLHLTQSQVDSPTFPKPDESTVNFREHTNITSTSTEASSVPAVIVISESTGQVVRSSASLLPQESSKPQDQANITSAMTYKSLSQHTADGEVLADASPELSRQDTEVVQEVPEQAQSKSNSLLSSEVSTESMTGFHFSLPPTVGEVLVASTCTTPPPIRTWQPPVSETPSAVTPTSDATSDATSVQNPPSLTFSMPRQDSPDSLNVGTPLPINKPSTSTAPIPPIMRPSSNRPAEMSVFARARKEAKRPREEQHIQEENTDPFLFTSQDAAVGPPVAKRQKTHPSRDNKETDGERAGFVFQNTTTIKTFKTITTVVRRITSIVTTKEDTGEVVDTVEYEDQDEPIIDEKVDVKVNVETILQTENGYVRQPTPRVAVEQLPRISPRVKGRRLESKKEQIKTKTTEDNEKSKNITEDSSEAETPPRLPTGTRVFARWSDGYYYPGAVIGIAEFATGRCYDVRFDDGDKRKIRPNQLVVRESLDIGQSVFAQDPDGFYDQGTIVGRPSGEDSVYEIELKKSKQRKRYLKKFIILSEKQVKTLLHTSGSSGTMDSESSKLLKSSSSNISSSSKSRDTSAKDTSGSSNELVAKDNVETPKSSRKAKRRNQKRKRRGAQSTSEESTEEKAKKPVKRVKRDLLKTSEPTRTSPRKKKAPSNDTMFAGFAFLITRCCNVSDSESELQEFDRAQIERNIEAGGGVILRDFSETQNTVADRCFLISNSYCRTVKYFQCLANGIPMVSHMWIHDCTILNRLQDYKKYLLPAGRSLETGEVVECKTTNAGGLLDELNIYVHGSTKFKSTWHSVISAAGAHVVTKLPNRPGRAAQQSYDEICNIVISEDTSLPQSLQYTCELLGIPIVSLEWLLQCLINGAVVHVEGHPKYDYKNKADSNESDVQ